MVREFLTTVQSSAQVLLELLNEILDLSKIEAGKVHAAEHARFRLCDVVDDLVRTYVFRAADKGLQLKTQIGDSVPTGVDWRSAAVAASVDQFFVERTQVHRSRTHWVGNRTASSSQKEAEVTFAVADTGIGISAADQQRIFAPFMQVDPSSTRRHSGTGLGLAIASGSHSCDGWPPRHSKRSRPRQHVFVYTATFVCAIALGNQPRITAHEWNG